MRSRWARLISLWRNLFRRDRVERDLDDEIQATREMLTAERIASGLAPAAAHRAASLDLGGAEQVKERVHEVSGGIAADALLKDLRYAARTLGKSRGFTLTAVLTLALGIGASTVGFSVFYNLLFNGFAAKDADRLVVPVTEHPLMSQTYGIPYNPALTFRDFVAIRDQNHVFEDMAAYTPTENVTLHDDTGTRQAVAARVSANALTFYGVPPLLGRGLTAEDGRSGAPPVFVIGHTSWRGQFGGDPAVVGKVFAVNGEPRTLVGVMPPRFHAYGAQLWIPIDLSHANDAIGPPLGVAAFARLKRGVPLAAATADLNLVTKDILRTHFSGRAGGLNDPNLTTARVIPASEYLMGTWGLRMSKDLLYAVIAAVVLFFLIGCSNVANLLLARATAREREMAVRAALGASRGRLIRQLLVEVLMLSIVACAGGCLLAAAALKSLVTMLPEQRGVAIEAVFDLNPTVLVFTVAVTVLTTFLCGLLPALRAGRIEVHNHLVGPNRVMGRSGGHGRLRGGLVITEVALSVVLFVGAGLMMRTIVALSRVELGFDPAHLMVTRLLNIQQQYPTSDQRTALMHQVLDRVASVPGVTGAAVTVALPGYGSPQTAASLPGGVGTGLTVKVDLCGDTLFSTLGLRTVRGGVLSATDVQAARHVAVVNESLVRAFFWAEDPIERKLILSNYGGEARPFTILGVVRDVKNFDPTRPALPMAYIPYTVAPVVQPGVLVRTTVDPHALVMPLSRQLWAVAPNVALDVTPLEDAFYRFTYAAPEFGLATIGSFAGLALLLVALGVSSVIAYTVSLRTHEFGVRMAIGARPRDVLTMVTTDGARLIAAGLGIGLLMSFGATRLVASQIWGVSQTDPLTLSAAVGVVFLVGLIASAIPARHATRIDPIVALRTE